VAERIRCRAGPGENPGHDPPFADARLTPSTPRAFPVSGPFRGVLPEWRPHQVLGTAGHQYRSVCETWSSVMLGGQRRGTRRAGSARQPMGNGGSGRIRWRCGVRGAPATRPGGAWWGTDVIRQPAWDGAGRVPGRVRRGEGRTPGPRTPPAAHPPPGGQEAGKARRGGSHGGKVLRAALEGTPRAVAVSLGGAWHGTGRWRAGDKPAIRTTPGGSCAAPGPARERRP